MRDMIPIVAILSGPLTTLLIVAICVLGPVWLIYQFFVKNRSAARLNAQDSATVDQLAQNLGRMENRIAVLERILDTELPDWHRHDTNMGVAK